MAKKRTAKLDSETLKEITNHVIDRVRDEEVNIVEKRHDRRRANIKLLLRRYREIATHVDEAVYDASQSEEDLDLLGILELMGDSRKETFRVEAIRRSAATSRIIMNHMEQMLETYRQSVERFGKDEDQRRYRVIRALYIDEPPCTIDQIAETEFVERRTIYRDIDAAADRLAVLFFGAFGLRFL